MYGSGKDTIDFSKIKGRNGWANKSYSDPNYLFIWPIIFLTNRQL
jgi:hypothetical protein